MTTTKTQGSALDSHKLKYEELPFDKRKLHVTVPKQKRSLQIKRPQVISKYFNALVEVILA